MPFGCELFEQLACSWLLVFKWLACFMVLVLVRQQPDCFEIRVIGQLDCFEVMGRYSSWSAPLVIDSSSSWFALRLQVLPLYFATVNQSCTATTKLVLTAKHSRAS